MTEQRSQPNDHCRTALVAAQPTSTTHAGLWFDKFFTALVESDTPKDEERKWELADMLTAFSAPEVYADWFNKQWKPSLAKETIVAPIDAFDVRQQAFSVRGRMVAGLGADAPLENSITLHRTYGVPYIPGSALKGLTAAYAHQRLRASEPEWSKGEKSKGDKAAPFHQILFGDTTSAGFITFFDALYIPGSAPDDRPLVLDVLTVHHQDYYQGKAPPADWDSPIPVPFLSAVGSYLVVLAGPTLWVGVAMELLKLALADMGIGAKTSSGYGRMQAIAHVPVHERLEFTQPKRRQKDLVASPRAQQASSPRTKR